MPQKIINKFQRKIKIANSCMTSTKSETNNKLAG